MEVLACLHHSLAHENEDDYELIVNWDSFKYIAAGLSHHRLSAKAAFPLLMLVCGIAMLTDTEIAVARTLQRGDSGASVLQLQYALNSAGYFYGPFTGYYGSLTQQAVARFQHDTYYLQVDGIAGSNTNSALGMQGSNVALVSNRGFLRYGSTGSDVRQLQYDLASAGYYSPSGPFTDYFGDLTQSAVLSLQRAYGLSVDGIVGPQTRSALTDALSGGSFDTAGGSGLLKFGSTGSVVTQLQYDLADAGVYDPSGPFTGYFGTLTESAVYRLQAYYGLTQDGVVGSATRSVLSDAIAAGGIPPYGSAGLPPAAQAPVPDPPEVGNEDSNVGQEPDGETEDPVVGQDPNGEIEDPNVGQDPNGETEDPVVGQDPDGETEDPTVGQEPDGETEDPAVGQEPDGETEDPTVGQDPNGETEDPNIVGDPDDEPMPIGFIQLNAPLQTYTEPNGEILGSPLGSGEILGYLEDRGDGWLRLGFPDIDGSWVFAGEGYVDVDFLNGSSSVSSPATDTPTDDAFADETEDAPLNFDEPTDAPTDPEVDATQPETTPEDSEPAQTPESEAPSVAASTTNIFVGPTSVEVQAPLELYDNPQGNPQGITLNVGEEVGYGAATNECWVRVDASTTMGWVFAGEEFGNVKFLSESFQDATIAPPACDPKE